MAAKRRHRSWTAGVEEIRAGDGQISIHMHRVSLGQRNASFAFPTHASHFEEHSSL